VWFRRSGDTFLPVLRVRNPVPAVRSIERKKPVKLRTRSRLLAGIITAGVLVIGGFGLATPADAASVGPAAGTSQATAVSVTPAEAAAANAAASQIAKIAPALTKVAGVYHLDAVSALALGGSRTTVEQLAIAVVADGGVVTGMVVPAAQVDAVANATSAVVKHCYGSSNYSSQWFGLQIKVNSCTVAKIIADIQIGAGATAIVAAILLAIPAIGTIVSILGGVAAGLLAIGSGILGNCAADGDGTIIDFGGGIAWCANQ
jgi:hypothetical protein